MKGRQRRKREEEREGGRKEGRRPKKFREVGHW
jgi:hypothetical protein